MTKQQQRECDLFTTVFLHQFSQEKRESIVELLAQMMKEIIQEQRKDTGGNIRHG